MIVRAPIIEAQIPETYLLSTLGYQSMIAAKACAGRVARLRDGRWSSSVRDEAHGPDAGVLAGRAAYIGGCDRHQQCRGRVIVTAFRSSARPRIPGCCRFARESEAFRRLQELLGPGTVYLIDTYDTVEGRAQGRRAWQAALGRASR